MVLFSILQMKLYCDAKNACLAHGPFDVYSKAAPACTWSSSDRAVGKGAGPHQHAEDRTEDGGAAEGGGVLESHACRLAPLVRVRVRVMVGVRVRVRVRVSPSPNPNQARPPQRWPGCWPSTPRPGWRACDGWRRAPVWQPRPAWPARQNISTKVAETGRGWRPP